MPKNLICPKCGKYQPNDKADRISATRAKNKIKSVVREGTKIVAKEAVGIASDAMLDGSGDIVKAYGGKGIGKGVDYIYDQLGFKSQSLASIKYLCKECGHQWDGYDRPDLFNETQRNTVKSKLKEHRNGIMSKIRHSLIGTVVSLLFVALSFYIWSNRHIDVETTSTLLLGESQVEWYSWHYYLFWPMIIISGISSIGLLSTTIGAIGEYLSARKISPDDFAANNLGLK